MPNTEQPFSAEIKLAIDIAKKHEDRVIHIIGTDSLPEQRAYACMVPPNTSVDPYSIYYLNNADPSLVGHRILHELGHVVRMLVDTPQQRLRLGYPSESVNTAARDLQDEINGLLLRRRAPQEQFTTLFQTSYLTLITNLYNFPMDIRVEQWIHDTFPAVRPTQDRFLRKEIQKTEASFNDTYIDDALPSVGYRHKAMIAARAIHTADLCDDRSILDPFANTTMTSLGRELVQLNKTSLKRK